MANHVAYAYLVSVAGLTNSVGSFAISDLRTLLKSSSVLPENMGPQITSNALLQDMNLIYA